VESRFRNLKVAAALVRYRRQNGNFPETLQHLVPEYIDTVPADVFDGAPLRYRRESAGGAVIWAVGENLLDDGGKIDPPPRSKKPLDIGLKLPNWE
jgi:hypothetical protein